MVYSHFFQTHYLITFKLNPSPDESDLSLNLSLIRFFFYSVVQNTYGCPGSNLFPPVFPESLVSVTSIESMTKEEPDQTAVENGSTDTNGLGEEGSSLSQEEEAQAELTPIAAAKPSRGRGTARRGRGRGRAKK